MLSTRALFQKLVRTSLSRSSTYYLARARPAAIPAAARFDAVPRIASARGYASLNPQAIQDVEEDAQIIEKANAFFMKGVEYINQDEKQLALECFNESVLLKPDPDTYHNIGTLHLTMGNMDDAIKAFEQSVSIVPTSETLTNLGCLYMIAHKDFSLSIKTLEQAQQLSPTDPEVPFNMGVIMEKQGMLREALEKYQAAKKLFAESEDAESPEKQSKLKICDTLIRNCGGKLIAETSMDSWEN